MGQSTEELTRNIESTRQDLSRDVDELSSKLSPHQILHRRKVAARSRLSSIRESLMGTASQAGHSISSAGATAQQGVSGMADSAQGTAHDAVSAVESRTEGSPLTMGAMAFGVGFLMSAVLPATKQERQLAQTAVETAKEHGQPVLDEAKSVGQELTEEAKGMAREAAESLKGTAQESAQHLKSETQDAARNVQDEAQPS